MIVVLFAATNFDAVVKMKDGKYKPIFEPLPECIEDVKTMKEVLEHYQISDEDATYQLIDEKATVEEFNKVYDKIEDELI